MQSRLAGLLTAVVGVWLLMTPLFLAMTGAALVNILVIGAIIAFAGLVELFWKNTLPSWLGALAAVWLFLSILLFDMSGAAAWNMVISAIVAFVLSVWDGAEVGRLERGGRLQT